jgi:trehalose 6-phosphate phosphatase
MQDALATALPEISRRVGAGEHAVLFLDFDGTLAPLQEDPTAVSLSPSMRAVLERCSACFALYFVSGRSLADIRARVNIPGARYAGNHGMEWWDGARNGNAPISDAARADVREALAALLPLAETPGARVEDKGLSATLHYRAVAPAIVETVRAQAAEILRPIVARGHVEALQQKMLVDVRPLGWHKGDFIRFAMEETSEHGFPIFIGDDSTDEDAFRMIQSGITIHVGTGDGSAAQYSLESIDAVQSFLERLVALSQ